MQIETIPFEQVDFAAYNPRKNLAPGDPGWRQIERSIEEFGLVEPLVYNRRSGRLVGGHQRMKILMSRGASEAEFSVVDLDEEREKLLNLALNNPGGEWDNDLLASVLREIRELPAFEAAGFGLEETADIIRTYEINHSADFLDQILDAPAETPSGDEEGPGPGSVTEAAHTQRGARYFTMQFALLPEQRRTVVEALVRVRQERQLATQVDALVAICDEALRGAAEAEF